MDRRRAALMTFLVTALLMEAFLVGFDFVADSFLGWPWLFVLLLVIPAWPVMAPIEYLSGLPLEVTNQIQNVVASIFWGFVAGFIVYSLRRKVTV
jgi:hypothetical protein